MSRLRLLLGGSAGLMMSNGIGRFAYTPILPLMQTAMGLSDGAAGLMASGNLLGYLLGALGCGRMGGAKRVAAYRAGIVVSVLACAAMALPLDMIGWVAVRFAAGVASALIYVLGTAFVLESGAAAGRGGAGLHFGGVGVGIALSGLVVQFQPQWQPAWLLAAALSLALAVPAWGVARPAAPRVTAARPHHGDGPRAPFLLLCGAYLLEGLGYVVSATFLVRVLHGLPATASLGPLAWVVVGAAAAPSNLLWAWAARRLGAWRALVLAFGLQAAGIALPLSGDPAATLIAAVLFGGTFMGISGMILTEGAALRPHDISRAMSLLTILFGIGQAIGPVVAGWAAETSGGFTWPLLGAAGATAGAGALALAGYAAAMTQSRNAATSGLAKDSGAPTSQ